MKFEPLAEGMGTQKIPKLYDSNIQPTLVGTTGYYKFSEFEAIKIPKILKALNFPTIFSGGCSFSEFLLAQKTKNMGGYKNSEFWIRCLKI